MFSEGSVDKDLEFIYRRLFLEKKQQHSVSAVISAVPQVGTSWCALNIAHALSLHNKKVLLVDGNGSFSNISTYVPSSNFLSLENYIRGDKTLNQLIFAYRNSNFNILTAQPCSVYLDNQPLGRIHIFSQDLLIVAKDYFHTIIDIGTSINEQNFGLCQIADNILILCSEKSSDLIKTIETIRFIRKMNASIPIYLIINRVASFEDGYKIYKEFCKAFGQLSVDLPDLLGTIRFDTRIRETIRNKEMLLTCYPSSEAAVDINNIALKLDLENMDE